MNTETLTVESEATQQAKFEIELDKLVDYFIDEYELTPESFIGVLQMKIIKLANTTLAEEDDDDDDYDDFTFI